MTSRPVLRRWRVSRHNGGHTKKGPSDDLDYRNLPRIWHYVAIANIKSQIKRNRTNEKARLRNKAAKSEVKTRIKKAVGSATSSAETTAEDLRVAVKRLDKAAARGIIHKNQASNRKSRLMRRINSLTAGDSES